MAITTSNSISVNAGRRRKRDMVSSYERNDTGQNRVAPTATCGASPQTLQTEGRRLQGNTLRWPIRVRWLGRTVVR
jgi:hypothetical protein